MAAVAEKPTFYRRPLPEDCVAFASARGRELFLEALEAGGAEGYWRLAECFHTQSDPGTCGLGSLSMVLNALAVDPGRTWKGVWRWFDESLLDCCVPNEQVARTGIDLLQLACLARCNGAEVRVRSLGTVFCGAAAHEPSLDDFEADVRAACFAPAQPAGDGALGTAPSQPAVCLLAAYTRKALGQTGDGHYSPVGAYAPRSRRVLIMDVARFKYPMHWVTLDALFEAMRPVDPSTSQPRGYLLLSAAGGRPAAFLTLSRRRACCGHDRRAWLALMSERGGALAEALAGAETAEAAARRVLAATAHLPDVALAVELYGQAHCGAAASAREAVVSELRAGALHAALLTAGVEDERALILALLLMASEEAAREGAAAAVRAALTPQGEAAGNEVAHLRAQLTALREAGSAME